MSSPGAKADALARDRAGREYWDSTWAAMVLPTPVDPHAPGLGNLFNRRMHALLAEILGQGVDRPRKLLEVGCGRSAWLSYFGRQFGFEVTGLDYSETGCVQEREILRRADVPGVIVCADLFVPPAETLGAFDIVFSFGVAEHFDDTAACLGAMARFLRPGGTMLTIVPNITGVIGWVQKVCNRAVYDKHVPLDAEDLRRAHERAGLQVVRSEYVLSTGFGMTNVTGFDSGALATRVKAVFLRNLGRLSVLVWAVEERLGRLPETRTFSPYILCVSRRPGA